MPNRSCLAALAALAVPACMGTTPSPSAPASPPGVGDLWTDTAFMDVAWWQDEPWRVAATVDSGADPEVRAWLLRSDQPDGSWIDASVGLVRVDGIAEPGSFVTRGWVARSPPVRLELERVGEVPGGVVRVGARHACTAGSPGSWAGGDWFFRVTPEGLQSLGELTTVDPATGCVAAWTSRIVSDAPLRFETILDGETRTYRLEGARWVPEPGAR